MPAFQTIFNVGNMLTAFTKANDAVARELRVELEKGMAVVEQDAKTHHRFKQGPGTHGHLENAITHSVSRNGLEGKVEVDLGKTPYADAVHNGSPAHKIFPKNKAALAFVMGGKQVLVPKNNFGDSKNYWLKLRNKGTIVSMKGYVNHPGTKPDKFLPEAMDRQKSYLQTRMQGAMMRAFQMVGFKIS